MEDQLADQQSFTTSNNIDYNRNTNNAETSK